MSYSSLPTVNSILNFTSLCLLIWGYVQIKSNNPSKHKKVMLGALASSTLFLISYLFYHYNVGSVVYPIRDWTRLLYFIILVPHIILAALMTPFIIIAVVFALKGKFKAHKRIVKWVFPVWVFVSISGIIVYLMLYVYAGASSAS